MYILAAFAAGALLFHGATAERQSGELFPLAQAVFCANNFVDGVLVWRGEIVNSTKPDTEPIALPNPAPQPGCVTTVTSTKGTLLNVPQGTCTSTVIVVVDAPEGLGGIIAGIGGFTGNNPVPEIPGPTLSRYSWYKLLQPDIISNINSSTHHTSINNIPNEAASKYTQHHAKFSRRISFKSSHTVDHIN